MIPRRSPLAVPDLIDDDTRCAICEAPLATDATAGCLRGRCTAQPLPPRFYAPVRAAFEYGRIVRMNGHGHRFVDRAAQPLGPAPASWGTA